MKLRAYLNMTQELPSVFADRIDVTVYAVRKWLSGERSPRGHNIVKIRKATKGAVTADDWLPAG